MAKILIVDDEINIRKVVKEYALANNHEVDEAENGLEAISKITENDYDVVVLDIMMPKVDGFSACREIKKIKDVPIIILSARQEEYDKLLGFDLGVDDYVVKPFSPRELGLRVKAILRRGDEKENAAETCRTGGLTVDFSRIQVCVKGKPVNLAAKEFELLTTLIKAKGRVLSREHLLDAIWGYDKAVDIQTRTVDVHIRTLRKKLKDEASKIVTVKGYGYRFDTEES
jgi:DNA-binding response OmpR family regulator